jgi:hypothetical protein
MELEPGGEEERELLLRLQSTVEDGDEEDDLAGLEDTEPIDYQNTEEGIEVTQTNDQPQNAAQSFLRSMQQTQSLTG